jgi:hypothetical protein
MNSDEFQAKAFRITTRIVSIACAVGLGLIGIAITFSFLVPLLSNAILASKLVLGKLALVNVCLLFGMFQSLLGVLLVLLGVTAPYKIRSETGPVKVNLLSASPGLLLVIVSACLIWISIGAKFEVSTETFEAMNTGGSIRPEESVKPQLDPAPLGVKGPE